MCFSLRGSIVFNRVYDPKKVYNGFNLSILSVDDVEFFAAVLNVVSIYAIVYFFLNLLPELCQYPFYLMYS